MDKCLKWDDQSKCSASRITNELMFTPKVAGIQYPCPTPISSESSRPPSLNPTRFPFGEWGFFCVFFLALLAPTGYITFMTILKDIITNWGYIDSNQLKSLAAELPDLPVIIKWGGMPREQLVASKASARIAEVEGNDSDYCREVFLSSKTLDHMAESYLTPNFIKLAINTLRAR